MRAKLWNAIQELMDVAEGAADVLDRYSDLESDGHGGMTPNLAAAYKQHLTEAVDALANLMNNEVPT